MKKIVFPLLLLFITTTIKAQQSKPTPLSIGEIHTLHSAILNENRTLNIYLPHQYDATKPCPVLYLLDGSIHEDFLHITGLMQFFNLQFNMPGFIVVGIANVDRKRDFTFHTDLEDLQKKYPTTGHSDNFILFLEKELQPFINKTYKTTSTNYLIGQSLGGLLATEVLLKKPGLFSHYLIVSPSLWWDNESMLNEAKSLLAKQEDKDRYIYVAVGKGEDKIMQQEATQIFNLLKDANKKNWQLDFNLMEKENHATILHNAIYEALLKLYPVKE